jgi:hypothetical protein
MQNNFTYEESQGGEEYPVELCEDISSASSQLSDQLHSPPPTPGVMCIPMMQDMRRSIESAVCGVPSQSTAVSKYGKPNIHRMRCDLNFVDTNASEYGALTPVSRGRGSIFIAKLLQSLIFQFVRRILFLAQDCLYLRDLLRHYLLAVVWFLIVSSSCVFVCFVVYTNHPAADDGGVNSNPIQATSTLPISGAVFAFTQKNSSLLSNMPSPYLAPHAQLMDEEEVEDDEHAFYLHPEQAQKFEVTESEIWHHEVSELTVATRKEKIGAEHSEKVVHGTYGKAIDQQPSLNTSHLVENISIEVPLPMGLKGFGVLIDPQNKTDSMPSEVCPEFSDSTHDSCCFDSSAVKPFFGTYEP